jgi:hypothetical protein
MLRSRMLNMGQRNCLPEREEPYLKILFHRMGSENVVASSLRGGSVSYIIAVLC